MANELRIPDVLAPASHEKKKICIVELVRLWGGSTSDAILDPETLFFTIPSIDGFVGYRLEKSCAVVLGDPVCAPQDKPLLAHAFHDAMEAQGVSIVYLAASHAFAHWAIDHVCATLFKFGNELILDPSCDPRTRTGTHASLLRRKTKQALREGVTIHEYLESNADLERDMERASNEWLASRKGHQIHISDIYLFDNRIGKRWFYAKKDHRVIGTISLNRLNVHNGWLLNHLVITPDSPNGTSELLVITALEALGKEGCRYATVGMVAGTEIDEIIGLSPVSTWLTKKIFHFARKIAHLDGLNTFWGKFHPQSHPSYALFSRKWLGIGGIMAVKKVLYGKQ